MSSWKFWIIAINSGPENRNFTNDFGFWRNHFCWIRYVRLLLGFKFHNFSNQYVSAAKENAFDQFQLILIDWKMAIFQTNWKWRGSSIIRFQTSIECTRCKINRILVKPKMIGSNWWYLSNESEKLKFHSGNQKICPVENSE